MIVLNGFNWKDSLIIQGKKNFINTLKKKITTQLLKEGIYSEIKVVYDKVLSDLYTTFKYIKDRSEIMEQIVMN